MLIAILEFPGCIHSLIIRVFQVIRSGNFNYILTRYRTLIPGSLPEYLVSKYIIPNVKHQKPCFSTFS
jgi:hypothetical protein